MKVLVFNRVIRQGYHEQTEGEHKDIRNKEMEEACLRAIRLALKHLSELTDKKLLELCYFEEEK